MTGGLFYTAISLDLLQLWTQDTVVSTVLDENGRIGYFVSPHGLGHASRASAVMGALLDIDPSIEFDIFSTVPSWFFESSLSKPFSYHETLTDIGLVQKTPFEEDVQKTVKRLDDFFPFGQNRIDSIASILLKKNCRLIICDISPMGIAVSRASGIPSVLIENFTWDWLYEAYAASDRGLHSHIEYLKGLFAEVDHHIQTEPVCCYRKADKVIPPISRKPRLSSKAVLEKLSIPQNAKVVMITMGGIPREYTIQHKLTENRTCVFVISGGSPSFRRSGNVVFLPYRSEFYHPDLIGASDVVIGKAGYSTLAEVYDAGVPFLFVTRPVFPESEVVSEFINMNMAGKGITEDQFEAGDWLSGLPGLFTLPKRRRVEKTGAQLAAEYIYGILK